MQEITRDFDSEMYDITVKEYENRIKVVELSEQIEKLQEECKELRSRRSKCILDYETKLYEQVRKEYKEKEYQEKEEALEILREKLTGSRKPYKNME